MFSLTAVLREEPKEMIIKKGCGRVCEGAEARGSAFDKTPRLGRREVILLLNECQRISVEVDFYMRQQARRLKNAAKADPEPLPPHELATPAYRRIIPI